MQTAECLTNCVRSAWEIQYSMHQPTARFGANGPDATNTRLGLSLPHETSSIPSSTSRSEAPSRLVHVSSVNLGDFSINCSIHAYRRLIDPRQRSLLRLQRHSHDCVRPFYFYDPRDEDMPT
jgi:hypothetical protein